MFVFSVKKGIDPAAVSAVMQSRPFLFFYRVSNQGESRVIPQLKAAKLQTLPFPDIKEGDFESVKLVSLVNRAIEIRRAIDEAKTDRDKGSLHSGFDSILHQIDSVVCQAYGLDQNDSKYIDEWLKR